MFHVKHIQTKAISLKTATHNNSDDFFFFPFAPFFGNMNSFKKLVGCRDLPCSARFSGQCYGESLLGELWFFQCVHVRFGKWMNREFVFYKLSVYWFVKYGFFGQAIEARRVEIIPILHRDSSIYESGCWVCG